MAYEGLTRFAETLASDPGRWAETRGSGTPEDPYTMPAYIHSETLRDFIHAFYGLKGFADVRYLDTIAAYGVEASVGGFCVCDIEGADLALVRAMLTCAVRQDRFCEGLLGDLAARGVVDRCLLRLRELDGAA